MIKYKEYYEAVTNSYYVYSRENFQIHGMHLVNICFSWFVIAKANKYLRIKNATTKVYYITYIFVSLLGYCVSGFRIIYQYMSLKMNDVQIVPLNFVKVILLISTCLFIVLDILFLKYGVKKRWIDERVFK